MTTTSRANEAHDHPVSGKRTGSGGIAHTHELDPSAPIAAAIKAHEDKYHVPVVPPPVDPPPVDPPPVDPPPATTVKVTSPAALHTALANDANTDITLAPGTYSGGLYLDSRFASRTKPCIIRLAGVTFNGAGLTFRGGAHDLEVLDPTFANWTVNQTGVLMFGGWDEAPAHHITVRRAKILSTVRRADENHTTDHAVYFSHSQGGVHDVLIEDLNVDATNAMGLASGIHMDHGGTTGLVNAWNVTVRRLVYKGNGLQGSAVQFPIILWTPPVHDWTFDGGTITNANGNAIAFESKGAARIVFKDIVSTGTKNGEGFYSSMGANPPGVTFVNCSLH